MTMAANLAAAAGLSYDQCNLAAVANTLKTKFKAFLTEVSPIFDDARENDRTVGNWIIPMWALSVQLDAIAGAVNTSQLDAIVSYLFRICYAGALAQSEQRIATAQADDLLAAWNTHFGT